MHVENIVHTNREDTDACFRILTQLAAFVAERRPLSNPFNARPSDIAEIAARDLMEYLEKTRLDHDFGIGSPTGLGKMFGVLVGKNKAGQIGYLSAFSGKLDCGTLVDGFVPPVFDTAEEGGFYKTREEAINQINRMIESVSANPEYQAFLIEKQAALQKKEEEIQALKSAGEEAKNRRKKIREEWAEKPDSEQKKSVLRELDQESARFHFAYKDLNRSWKQKMEELENKCRIFESEIDKYKEKRRSLSARLQADLFRMYNFLDARGQTKSLHDIFCQNGTELPPSGAGECAAPKLFHYAFAHGITPVAVAEFWWGKSPASEIRLHRHFYPACRSKCKPILTHMLAGLDIEDARDLTYDTGDDEIAILYEDEYLVVVSKPANFLSVPGKEITDSVLTRLKKWYPDASGPLLVHRLDMSTSGILLAAKNKDIHAHLQRQFETRTIQKRYVALLENRPSSNEGKIELPLRVDLDDRPRQLVCYEHGKPALTYWKMVAGNETSTRVHFFPVTGRTHQLRVHAAHAEGLGIPILGDDLYGQAGERLFLHAEQITFTHPVTGKSLRIISPCPF